MSSMIAFAGAPTQSAYCMAKSAVKALSESLRAELASRGVGVTCVFPGTVRTALVRELPGPPIVRKLLEKLDGVGIAPERVAEAIIDGVERNAPRVLVGSDSFLVDRVARVSPTAIPAIAGVAMRAARRWL
jgi:short-subunit dehydrogenase